MATKALILTWRLFKVIHFGSNRYVVYDFILYADNINSSCNFRSILFLRSEILQLFYAERREPLFHTPTPISAKFGVCPLKYIQYIGVCREWRRYVNEPWKYFRSFPTYVITIPVTAYLNIRTDNLPWQYRALRSIVSQAARCGSGNTVVTMTSKVNGKMEILPPVELIPLKILKPKLNWMIMSSISTTVPIFVEIGPNGPAP